MIQKNGKKIPMINTAPGQGPAADP